MNRKEQLQKLAFEHAPVVDRMRDFAEGVIGPSVDILEYEYARSNAIQIFLNGILNAPEFIDFRGKTFADFTMKFRRITGSYLNDTGLQEIGAWHKTHWMRGNRKILGPRIMDKNINHFIEGWYGNDNSEHEPDWDAMQNAHDSVVVHHSDEKVYWLYANFFNGFQTAAIECYLEDTAPPDASLYNYLLQ